MKQIDKSARIGAMLLCLLLVLLSAVGLFGCGTPSEEPKDSDKTGAAQETTAEVAPKPADITFPMELITEKKMKIVYRQGADTELIDAAKSLRAAIASVFGTEIGFTSDYLRDGSETYCEYEYEILVGETNRKLDAGFQNLRADDYRYGVSGKKLVLLGGSTYASVQAATAFTYDIVLMKKGHGEVFYRSDWDTEKKAEYSIEKLTLNGVDITSYTIVYPKNGSLWESGLAEHLAYRLELWTGRAMTVTDDSTAYADGYELLIGRTNRSAADALAKKAVGEREGVYGAVGKLAVLSGGDCYGICTAAEAFLTLCEGAIDPTSRSVEVTLGEAKTVRPSESVSTMSFNLQSYDLSTARGERAIQMIKAYLPDVLGVQEATVAWTELLNAKLGGYYEMVGELRKDPRSNERTAVLVAKSRLTITEHGTRWLNETNTPGLKSAGSEYVRIFTYAMLRDAVTSHEWLQVNTHLDFASESVQTYEVRLLLDFLHSGYENVPIVLTGDMNAKTNTAAIKLLEKSGLTSATDMTEEKNAMPDIDWIFATADCVKVSLYHECNERLRGGYPSDHFPILAELSFFLPEDGIHHDFGDTLPEVPEGDLQPSEDEDGEGFGPIHRIF